jgi:hypothetical protein
MKIRQADRQTDSKGGKYVFNITTEQSLMTPRRNLVSMDNHIVELDDSPFPIDKLIQD